MPTSPSNQTQQVDNTVDENSILQKIAAQGDKVRDLKSQKADKATIDAEVKILLANKAEYKAATGKDWKLGTVTQSPPVTNGANENKANSLLIKIKQQGDKVRQIKTGNNIIIYINEYI